jgi:hypothetical protein
MKSLSTLLTLAALAATSALAQMSQPMVSENTTRISDHVWAIMGFPNIAIVVGSHATLVVDTGLGPKNGATAAPRSASFSAIARPMPREPPVTIAVFPFSDMLSSS